MAGGIVQGQLSEDIKIGGSTEIIKTQAAHGFSLYQPIYHNGSIWVLAQADNADTLAEYLVTEVTNANEFIGTKFGEVEAIGHGFIVGEHYFLDDTIAGGVTISQPGAFSCPVFYVEDANTLHVEIYRPFAVNESHSTLQDARADADGSGLEGCTITVEGLVPNLVTQLVLDAPFIYTVGRNPGGAYGDLVVSVNGQRIERFITGINDSTGEIGYTELNNSTILISTKTATGSDQLPAGAIINVSRVEVTNGLPPDTTVKWQTKILSGNIISNGPVPELTFSSLEIGSSYEIVGQVSLLVQTNGGPTGHIKNGSTILAGFQCDGQGGVEAGTWGVTTGTFVANATTVFLDMDNASASDYLEGDGTKGHAGTWLELRKLPTHIETTEW